MELWIDDMVYQEVMHYVNMSEFEVSGLGAVIVDEIDDEKVFRVVSCILLDQENTRASSDFSAQAFGKAEYEHHKSKTPGTLNWWWHSHATMDAYWSGTDMQNFGDLSENGWFIGTVFNQREEMRSAIRIGKGVPLPVFVDDITTVIDRSFPEKLIKSWDKKYEKHVKNTSWNLSGASKLGDLVNSMPGSQRGWTWSEGYYDKADDDSPSSIHIPDYSLWEPDGLCNKVFEKAIEAGFDHQVAEKFAERAEQLAEDGHYSMRQIESRMVQTMLNSHKGGK